MATSSGDPAAAGEPAAGEPAASSSAPGQPHHPTPRTSHIVRTYLGLSSTSRKRRACAAPKNQPKPATAEAPAARENKGCGPSGSASLQPSRLLRELGVRVSRYTHEERRDVITRYMQKRGGRQGVNRAAAKVPSRQALAERRRRGAGGKFLSKEEEAQTADKPEEKAEEEERELPPEVVANAGGVPIVGMVFENEEKAYKYYVSYAGDVGFSVRKGLWDKTAKSGTISRFYVCSREGFRSKNQARRPCPDTRTGCPARLSVKVTSSGKYRVTEFIQDHNHQLAGPFDIGMLKSQRVFSKAQSGNGNAINIPPGYKNYLRTKSTKDMDPGDFRALTDYFRSMKSENPSFYYAIQVDESDKAANVFWADARSILDYHYFSDVICFDMTYKVNDYSRPLALFVGMNHHRQMVIFGAAFLYDETAASFKWLLETFKSAMCGKQPKTILTDRSANLKEALGLTWPGTVHSSCVWQIYQNAVKSLAHAFSISEEFTHDFSHCVFDIEDDQEFLDTWNMIIEKYNLKENKFLNELYGDRENWALPYVRHTFSGDIKNMLRAETFGIWIKEYMGCEKELSPFLKYFGSSVEKRRQEEIQADYQASQGAPRAPVPLLWQAANWAQLTHMDQNDYPLGNSNEAQKSIGKKKSEVARRGNGLEANKRQKRRKGPCDKAEAGPRDGELTITPDSMQTVPRTATDQFLPDQLMHGHYVLGHNFSLSTSHNLHDDLNQFGQASTVPTLQQQPFPGNGQLTQAYPVTCMCCNLWGRIPKSTLRTAIRVNHQYQCGIFSELRLHVTHKHH
ncbi:hypothetical protein ACQ4PT_058836 [Festuca glaucescens]